jgi:cytochrome c oxidase cbb3-type subunit 3
MFPTVLPRKEMLTMSDMQDKLLDHDYDGIRELDNDLPRWWLWLFYGCIAWAVLYMLYFHVFQIGYSSADEYRQEINPGYERVQPADAKILGVISEYRSPLYDPTKDIELASKARKVVTAYKEESRDTDTTTYIALTDQDALADGKAIFVRSCVSCHGNYAEGKIGPNLTDDYWLHGAGMSNVVKTIKYGYPTKGMLAWRGELKPEQIIQVASYVLSLHGTNPPNPKPPQGDLVKQ